MSTSITSTDLTAEELLAHATEFTFYPAGAKAGDREVGSFTVKVAYRSPGLFAVVRHGHCWDGKKWEYESQPSSRTERFLKKTRFPLEEASGIARSLVDTVSVNGRTWVEWQEHFAANGGEE